MEYVLRFVATIIIGELIQFLVAALFILLVRDLGCFFMLLALFYQSISIILSIIKPSLSCLYNLFSH